jgi:hypothetical protein
MTGNARIKQNTVLLTQFPYRLTYCNNFSPFVCNIGYMKMRCSDYIDYDYGKNDKPKWCNMHLFVSVLYVRHILTYISQFEKITLIKWETCILKTKNTISVTLWLTKKIIQTLTKITKTTNKMWRSGSKFNTQKCREMKKKLVTVFGNRILELYSQGFT